MSRNHLASVLLLSLLTACSSVKMGNIGPHRIDVQQGNALDQESVAKLKPGLNRSQVRFLLGTPLLVDPFRNNRWDYVYTFHKGGKLAEQKRITLFFDGEILQRIEGDVPPADLKLREDLRTRLGGGNVFALQLLSEAELRTVLGQEAQARGVNLSAEVVDYLLRRFSRDLGSLMQLLEHLDRYALQTQRAITIPLVKSMLETI